MYSMAETQTSNKWTMMGAAMVGAVAATTLVVSLTGASTTNMYAAPSTIARPMGVSTTAVNKFTNIGQLPMDQASAAQLMSSIMAPRSAQVDEVMMTESTYQTAAPAAATNPLMALATLAAFIGGWALKKPVTTKTWAMAAADGDADADFEAGLAKLKKKGFGESKAPAASTKAAKKPLAVSQMEEGAASARAEPAENFDDEELFMELKPSPSELIVPVIGSFFIIGLIPLATGVVRQLWVRFKITSRRVQITSGWGGEEQTEISFAKISSMKYVRRSFGATGDLVLNMANGGGVDMQGVPNFPEVYNYIYERVSPECQAASPNPIK